MFYSINNKEVIFFKYIIISPSNQKKRITIIFYNLYYLLNLEVFIWKIKKEKRLKGFLRNFTKKYNITQLVYVEEFQNVNEAIHREKCIKKWNRAWKLRLIGEQNPDWRDLYEDLI